MPLQCLFQSKARLWAFLQCLLLGCLWIAGARGMRDQEIRDLRLEAEHMFYHGYDSYIKYAFPEDELRPLSCKPLTRDRANPAHIELNDALGNYSLTLIDSLSTLAILASSSSAGPDKSSNAFTYFQVATKALVEQYGDGTEGPEGRGIRARGFDLDSKVQVFETVIRGVGGLLSAHEFAVGELPITSYDPQWIKASAWEGEDAIQWDNGFIYNGQLLRLALDLASRLLPAFETPTGIPYPRVNLRYGVPFYANSPLNNDAEHGTCRPGQQPVGEITETCSAGAGSLVLEFATLSRLSGIPIFEEVAKQAFWAIWDRRSAVGLIGSGIDAETGQWTSPFTGIGAGIDSFFEYAVKSYILLSGSSENIETPDSPSPTTSNDTSPAEKRSDSDAFLEVWQAAHAAVDRHIHRGENYIHSHYIQADLHTGAARAFWFDSLSAFFPGLLTLTGDLEEAIQSHLLLTAVWTRYSALPERWSVSSGSIEGGLNWWGGRPEFIESTYHLYRATQDPWYLHVAEMVLRDIKRRCWTKCGWAGIQDVRNGEKSDRMESFFLGETTKYLLLIFDPEHPLNKIDAPFVFTTEGHPLILPRSSRAKSRTQAKPRGKDTREPSPESVREPTCPTPPPKLPFSISAVAARGDIFHAAKLARLDLMPKPDTVDSPLADYSHDHPSISISDIRSPSNFTYYPWTLPPELIPFNATCSKINSQPTFDITFPADSSNVLNAGALQRVLNGIFVNSMSGIRFNMVQDVPSDASSNPTENTDLFRIQAINNVLLGKDEKIFLPRDILSAIVSAQDPNFSRVRDTSMLDLVIDTKTPSPSDPNTTTTSSSSLTSPTIAPFLNDGADSKCDSSSPMRLALNSLMQQFTSLIHNAQSSAVPTPEPRLNRHYLPAISPTGAGAAPIPDLEEALGPAMDGSPRGALLWQGIFVGDQNCDRPLPASVPRDHQVLVLRRGGCSFAEKLQNIPSYAPSKTSLQMVVVVSYAQDDEAGLPAGWLIRPLLDETQVTPKGLLRRNPIVMVLVGGGEETWGWFGRAVGVGVKRRYVVKAQGVVVSNLVVT